MKQRRYVPVILLALLFPWVIAVDPDIHNTFYVFASIMASMICLYVGFSAKRIYNYLAAETSLVNRSAFLTVALFVTLLLTCEWPGWPTWDDVELLRSVSQFDGSARSSIYSLMVGGLLILSRGWPFMISLVNLVTFLNLAALLFSMQSGDAKRPYIWLILLVLMLPPSYTLVLLQNRDSLFSIVFLFLIFGLLQQFSHRRFLLPITWQELVLCGVALGAIRQDGILIAAFVPFLTYCFYERRKARGRRVLLKYVGWTAFGLGLVVSVGVLLNSRDFRPSYLATTLANPLGYVLHEKGIGFDRDFSKEHSSRSREPVEHVSPFTKYKRNSLFV